MRITCTVSEAGVVNPDDYIIAVIPSVGDAIDALGHVHEGLSQTLKQFLDFSAELASKDHAMENIPEVGPSNLNIHSFGLSNHFLDRSSISVFLKQASCRWRI